MKYYINYLFENTRLELKSQIRYRFNFYSDILVFTVLLFVFLLSKTGMSFENKYEFDYKWLFLIGYLLWTSSIAAVDSMNTYFINEAKISTLQNSINSKFSMKFILLVDLITSQFIHIIKMVIITLIAEILLKVEIVISPYLIIPFILNVAGFYGIGLILSALSLYFKKINSVLFIIKLSLLFITDTVPTIGMLKNISNFIPLTIANNISRKISMGIIDYNLIFKLGVLSLFYIILGMIVFNILYKKSKIKGNILFYWVHKIVI